MSTIKINDIEMYYQQQGKGEDLVLIAGASADHTAWDPIYEELTQHYRVLRFDNRGVGQTDAPSGPYSIPQMAEDTAGLMETLKIGKAYVVGHSMGGYIAQQFALAYPDKLKKLVIVTSRAKPSAGGAILNQTWQTMLTNGIAPELVIKNAMGIIFAHDFLADEKKVQQFIEKKLNSPYPQTPEGLAGQQTALNAYDSTELVAEIKVPTLVIAGEADGLLPLFNSQFLAKKISSAKLAIIKGCGHMPQYEKPQQLLELIEQFCR